MKYAYNLIEIKSKSDFGFCPQSLKNLEENLIAYFPKEVELSAVKFVRDNEGEEFVRTTIAERCLKLYILEVDRKELVNKDNRVVMVRGELEGISPFTDVEALRLDDDAFRDFEQPTYVNIAYDLTNRVGVLYRAFYIDEGEIGEGIPIMLGEDLQDCPEEQTVDHLRSLGVPKAVLKTRGLISNLPYLT